MYDPQSRALTDLAINNQNPNYIPQHHPWYCHPPTSTAKESRYNYNYKWTLLNQHQPWLYISPTIHSILPNLAAIAWPPTIPQEQLCQYFLTTLSPKRARGRFKEATAHYKLNDLYEIMSIEMPDHIHLLPSILSPTTSYPIAGMSRSQTSHRLSPITFTLNMRRKLRLPILPYKCKCQCNKVYDIYGDHPFNCHRITKEGGPAQSSRKKNRVHAGTHLTRLARRSAKNPKRKRQILAKIDFGPLAHQYPHLEYRLFFWRYS